MIEANDEIKHAVELAGFDPTVVDDVQEDRERVYQNWLEYVNNNPDYEQDGLSGEPLARAKADEYADQALVDMGAKGSEHVEEQAAIVNEEVTDRHSNVEAQVTEIEPEAKPAEPSQFGGDPGDGPPPPDLDGGPDVDDIPEISGGDGPPDLDGMGGPDPNNLNSLNSDGSGGPGGEGLGGNGLNGGGLNGGGAPPGGYDGSGNLNGLGDENPFGSDIDDPDNLGGTPPGGYDGGNLNTTGGTPPGGYNGDGLDGYGSDGNGLGDYGTPPDDEIGGGLASGGPGGLSGGTPPTGGGSPTLTGSGPGVIGGGNPSALRPAPLRTRGASRLAPAVRPACVRDPRPARES
ncbi:hypothetical protein GCM10029992_01170 [Glycomyces albus]